jgi:hypothetical protein
MKCISVMYSGVQHPGVLISKNPFRAFVYRGTTRQWSMAQVGDKFEWFTKYKTPSSVTLIDLTSDCLGVDITGRIVVGQWVEVPRPMYKTTLHLGRPYREISGRIVPMNLYGYRNVVQGYPLRYWQIERFAEKEDAPANKPIPTRWLTFCTKPANGDDVYTFLDPVSTIFNSFRSTLVEVVGKDA